MNGNALVASESIIIIFRDTIVKGFLMGGLWL